jgi:hypothetical protein
MKKKTQGGHCAPFFFLPITTNVTKIKHKAGIIAPLTGAMAQDEIMMKSQTRVQDEINVHNQKKTVVSSS